MSERVLYVMTYSPWSERARWMLQHHGMPFEQRVHVPMIGELSLRRAARRWAGPVSVPLLVDGDVAVMDSLAIAQHVDARGHAEKLLPSELVAPISALNEQLDVIIQAGRQRGVEAILTDSEAAIAALPRALRKLPFAVASSHLGTRFLASKYRRSFGDPEQRTRAGLLALRAALRGRPYVHDRFTYADIIAATALHFIVPVSERYVPMEPALRRIWTHAALAAEFRELVEWRDTIYAKHRPVA